MSALTVAPFATLLGDTGDIFIINHRSVHERKREKKIVVYSASVHVSKHIKICLCTFLFSQTLDCFVCSVYTVTSKENVYVTTNIHAHTGEGSRW